MIIEAFNKLGLPLKVYGKGPLQSELEQMANENIEFLGFQTDKELVELYQNARAFIVMATDEDFGITPVEAMAAGCPVIAANAGGYRESVVDGKTGILVGSIDVDSIATVVKKIEDNKVSFVTSSMYKI